MYSYIKKIAFTRVSFKREVEKLSLLVQACKAFCVCVLKFCLTRFKTIGFSLHFVGT